MKEDALDVTWKKFAASKGGKFSSEERKGSMDRFNSYEKYFIEYAEVSHKVIIELYMQLIPARGNGPFLERKTSVTIHLEQARIQMLNINYKSFFNSLFSRAKRILSGNSQFDSKYFVEGFPKDNAETFLKSDQILSYLLELKLTYAEIVNDKESNTFIMQFPSVIYLENEISKLDTIITHFVSLFNKY